MVHHVDDSINTHKYYVIQFLVVANGYEDCTIKQTMSFLAGSMASSSASRQSQVVLNITKETVTHSEILELLSFLFHFCGLFFCNNIL